METIALVQCAKKKGSARAPARDLYISALFRKSRRWAEANSDRWFVLSARYGLVAPSEEIEPYDETLNMMTRAEIIEWARRVHQQMREVALLRPGVHFVWLAGRNYKDHLSRLLQEYPQEDPLQGRKIGQRLQWLDAQLD